MLAAISQASFNSFSAMLPQNKVERISTTEQQSRYQCANIYIDIHMVHTYLYIYKYVFKYGRCFNKMHIGAEIEGWQQLG